MHFLSKFILLTIIVLVSIPKGYADSINLNEIYHDYDEVVSLSTLNGSMLIVQNEKYGVMDSRGHIIIPPNYEYIEDVTVTNDYEFIRTGNGTSQVFYIVMQQGEFGLIDEKGNLIVEPKYSDLRSLVYPSYFVISDSELSNKVALINTKGEIVNSFEFNYDSITKDPYEINSKIYMLNMDAGIVDIYDSQLNKIDVISYEEFKQIVKD